jgi:hypothetical protein
MKTAARLLVIALVGGSWSIALGQTSGDHAVGLPGAGGYPTPTKFGTTSKDTTGGVTASATPDPETKTADHDDALYRGKTSDSANPMLRDDGALHFKTHPGEKAHEIDSKKLFSSGTDPRFQGELAISGVSSIEKIAPKPEQTQQENAEDEDQGDPRFRTRRLIFAPDADEKQKTAQKNSSPAPSPSPSASAKAKSSRASKE